MPAQLFYYFVGNGRLYCLPMDIVRPWFHENMERFAERRTSTPVGNGEYYVTIGRLVPIAAVLDEVAGILQFAKQNDSWDQIYGRQTST